jgi:hypothetical protein
MSVGAGSEGTLFVSVDVGLRIHYDGPLLTAVDVCVRLNYSDFNVQLRPLNTQ